jgi:thiol:disulfide interchange protein DsbD
MSRRLCLRAFLLSFLLLTTGLDALAKGGNVEVGLLSDQSVVLPGRPFYVGVRMKIREGWHTYWKNPGDSGLPPRISWTLPEGFVAGPIEWPIPERFADQALMTYGYRREVLFPVRITPPMTIRADSVTIAGKIDWLECKDVCLPGSAALRLSLPVSAKPGVPGPDARALAAALARVPRPPAGWSLSAEAGPRAIALTFVPPTGITPRGAYFFVDQPLVTEHAAPQGFERAGDRYRVTMSPAVNASRNLARLTGVLIVGSSGALRPQNAVQVDVPVIWGGNPAPAPRQRAGLSVVAYAGVIGMVGLALALIMRGILSRKSKYT